MKIVHVITRLIVGGAQENTILTCRGLVDRGHEVTLIAGPETGPEGSLWKKAEQSGASLIKVEELTRAVRPLTDIAAVRQIRGILEDLRPDIVHTHSSKAGILAREAARRARVPLIVHTIHGMSFNRTQSAIVRGFYRYLERRAGKVTNAFISVADAMTDQAVAAGLAPRDRFTTIYSGMQTNLFAADPQRRCRVRARWGADDDAVIVGTIARLFDNKGYEEILQALPAVVERVPRIRFVWVGDGANRQRYERRLQQLGLSDRVYLTGLIAPEDVAAQIDGFDIVLHASRWEGLPRAIVQGLLAGKPAISFDNDGAPEVVITNETGRLVPMGDIPRLTEAIVEFAEDKEKRVSCGERGRLLCRERFDWHNMVAAIESLYVRLYSPDKPR
ncbi:MAG: glycosyltransferase family 4 protein [Planctomycetes bacterium]|nr:glycosyltransferase family 4 protein [Planctomycetota bacterium]